MMFSSIGSISNTLRASSSRLIPALRPKIASTPRSLPSFRPSPLSIPTRASSHAVLEHLGPIPGSAKNKQRVGRGVGSKRGGHTSGRGHKGAKARGTGNPYLGFEGGQTPLYRRIPKRGFINPCVCSLQCHTLSLRAPPLLASSYHTLIPSSLPYPRPPTRPSPYKTSAHSSNRKTYYPLKISTVQRWIAKGRFDPKETLTIYHAIKTNMVHGIGKYDGITLAGGPDPDLPFPALTIHLSRFTPKAAEAVIKAGGTCVAVYHNELSLRAEIHPDAFEGARAIRPAWPTKRRDIGECGAWPRRWASPSLRHLDRD